MNHFVRCLNSSLIFINVSGSVMTSEPNTMLVKPTFFANVNMVSMPAKAWRCFLAWSSV